MAPRHRASSSALPAVLLGGAVNALSVGRSLWRRGVAVDFLADGQSDSVSAYSRACRRYVKPSSADVSGDWMQWLADKPSAALLPCSDEGVEFVARNRSALESMGHRPIEADDNALLAMLDKQRAYELARRAGVPAPRTKAVTSVAELDDLDFTYPCGVKPIQSHLFARRFRPNAKAAMLTNAAHAKRVLAPLVKAGYGMLLTEVVGGPDDRHCSYYTYLDGSGEPLVHFTKRKLRQYPTHFGLGSYHITEWDLEVAELGLRFARAAGLRGMVNVEFKHDTDGQLKLIECNPRFTAANEQVRVAGIDLAEIAYNRLAGIESPMPKRFRDGLGLWLVVDDIRALRDYRHAGELTIVAWLKTLLRRQVAPMFAWSDPRPSAVVWSRRTRGIARKALRRGGARVESNLPDPFDVVG